MAAFVDVIAAAGMRIDLNAVKPPEALTGRVLLLVALLIPAFTSDYVVGDVLVRALIFGILAVSLDLAWGYGGILSLGHGALFGIGAYAMGIIVREFDSPLAPTVAVFVGIALPAAIGLAVGALLFYAHASKLYVAVFTLSMSLLVPQLVLRLPDITGGNNGLSGLPRLPFGGAVAYYVVLVISLAVLFGAWRLVRSDFGRLLRAVRDNETRCRALGYDTAFVKMIALGISGAIAGIAGVLFPLHSGFVSQSLPGFVTSTSAIVWVAIGGRGGLVGPFVAAVGINWLATVLNAQWPHFWQLGLGLTFILVVVFFRDGLRSLVREGSGSAAMSVALREPTTPGQHVAGLVIEGLRVGYGKLSVLRGVDLDLRSGSLLSLIGPNGAGKSTLVASISGHVRAGSGAILLGEKNLASKDSLATSRLGLGRTFQTPSLFEDLTVGENLYLASGRGRITSYTRRSDVVALAPHVESALRTSGLYERIDDKAGTLSHGERKWLEILMVMSSAPDVVLLDEPTAGLTPAERVKAGKMLRTLADQGVAVLLIEHDIEFVRSVADELAVLIDGRVIARGPVDGILRDPAVRELYLGMAGS